MNKDMKVLQRTASDEATSEKIRACLSSNVINIIYTFYRLSIVGRLLVLI